MHIGAVIISYIYGGVCIDFYAVSFIRNSFRIGAVVMGGVIVLIIVVCGGAVVVVVVVVMTGVYY